MFGDESWCAWVKEVCTLDFGPLDLQTIELLYIQKQLHIDYITGGVKDLIIQMRLILCSEGKKQRVQVRRLPGCP